MKVRFFLFLLCISVKVMAADECEKLWYQVASSGKITSELLVTWSAKEKECKGDSYYDYRKVLLLYELKRFDEAKNIIMAAKIKYKNQDSLIQFLDLVLERQSLIEKGDLSTETAKKYLNLYLKLDGSRVSKYAEYPAEVAALSVAVGNMDEGIIYAKKSLDVGEWSSPLRILILIYDAKEDYVAGKEYIDRLATADAEMLKNRKEILLACARIYAGLGRIDLTNAALQMAAQKSEKGKDDPDIQKTVAYIKNGIQTGKFKVVPK